MRIGYKKIFLVVFFVWIGLWLNFFIRDLTKNKYIKDYKALLSRDADGKSAYTYGDRLFEFLKFCNNALPEDALYDVIGIEDLDLRRTVYYLYPHINKTSGDYILVFDKAGYVRAGYAPFKELDSSRFILKRI